MTAPKQPPIVAELGRPETPAEAAERRTAARITRRQSQTFVNLLIALFASLAVVAIAVLVVVRPDAAPNPAVDYRAISTEADAPVPLAAPDLGTGWHSNSAVYNSAAADGVATWYVGLITPQNQFIGLRQGIDANPTWLANQLAGTTATGSTTVDGIQWSVYDRRGAKNAGNLAYSMSASGARSTWVLFGTASVAEFTELAHALTATIASDH